MDLTILTTRTLVVKHTCSIDSRVYVPFLIWGKKHHVWDSTLGAHAGFFIFIYLFIYLFTSYFLRALTQLTIPRQLQILKYYLQSQWAIMKPYNSILTVQCIYVKIQAQRQFSVFMWRHDIPKLDITLPSEVSVPSDKRPYRTLTFHNVLARQVLPFVTEHVWISKILRCVTRSGGSRRLSRRSNYELSL